MKTTEMARGKWRGILLALGVDSKFLTGKHGPCPFCEGRDRFRWDDEGGKGSFICSQCGAGDGIAFLMRAKGWSFKQTADQVDRVVGNVRAEAPKRKMDGKQRNDMLNRLWQAADPLRQGDPAYAYLSSRVKLPPTLPACLRFAASCPVPDASPKPAMIALVHGPDNAAVNIHRTFLGPNGKADMDNPRAMMPGPIPDGSAVRLFPVHGELLGIAEGIETALAASARFGIPVWSAINSATLAKWEAPANVREVFVFGDADAKFGGQAAAYALAHRLAARRHLHVAVHIPGRLGLDWADSDAA